MRNVKTFNRYNVITSMYSIEGIGMKTSSSVTKFILPKQTRETIPLDRKYPMIG